MTMIDGVFCMDVRVINRCKTCFNHWTKSEVALRAVITLWCE